MQVGKQLLEDEFQRVLPPHFQVLCCFLCVVFALPVHYLSEGFKASWSS